VAAAALAAAARLETGEIMKSVLTSAERERIGQIITEIETSTASELVTVVFRRSSAYAAHRIGWSAGTALALVSLAHLVWPHVGVMELLGAQALFVAMLYAFFGLAPCLRLIVPRWAMQRAVHAKVQQLFLELGITETRDRSGVLIYLSELEHRVEILGDRGIHQQMGPEAWQSLVTNLVASIRKGKAAEGLESIVRRLGAELTAKFPIRAGDTNELPNQVLVEPS
jgi:putative membrane protein